MFDITNFSSNRVSCGGCHITRVGNYWPSSHCVCHRPGQAKFREHSDPAPVTGISRYRLASKEHRSRRFQMNTQRALQPETGDGIFARCKHCQARPVSFATGKPSSSRPANKGMRRPRPHFALIVTSNQLSCISSRLRLSCFLLVSV